MAEQPHSQPLVPFERETSWQRAHQGCNSAQPPPRVPEDLSRLFFPSPVMGTAFLPKPTPVPVGRGARQVRVRAAPALPAIPAAPQLPKPDTLFPAPETRRDKQDARDNSSSGKKKKRWETSVGSHTSQRVRFPGGVSAQRGSRSRAPPIYFHGKDQALCTAERWGTRCTSPQTWRAPRLRVGGSRAPRHARGSLAAPRPQRFWVMGSLCPGCSFSLIWKTNHGTPTKCGVRPRPMACHNPQFAKETAAALATPWARPHCQSGTAL